jgi:DNA mismatch repair ATPase MutS
MRLSDSLADSESYFAEIKRLKQIMDELHHTSFILLDEIFEQILMTSETVP